METILSSLHFNPFLVFVISSGVVLVGIYLVFSAIDWARSIVNLAGESGNSFAGYESSHSIDLDFSNSDLSRFEYRGEVEDFSKDEALINHSFNPNVDWDKEKKYDDFESAYIDYSHWQKTGDVDSYELWQERINGKSLEAWFDENQEELARYRSENPSEFSDSIEFNLSEDD